MACPLVERRREPRVGHPEIAGTYAILRPGYMVAIVDLSAGGMLIEGPRPLRPGAHVHLRLVTGTRRLALSGQVLRCAVSTLDTPEGVHFRGVVRFDQPCASPWEDRTLAGYLMPTDDGRVERGGGHSLPMMNAALGDIVERPPG